jgi:lipoprotein-anchoring transpeptidase ErfK/SrfK
MLRTFKLLLISIFIVSLFPLRNVSAQDNPPPEEPASGAVICPPGVYLTTPADCLPLGPSAYMTSAAKLGISVPPRPLPAFKPNPGLTEVPYHYFKLDDTPVPVFSGIPADPQSAGGAEFPPGFNYVSYIDRVDTGHGIYYMLPSGQYIPGRGARVSEISKFQGLQFSSNPRNSFGWTFEQLPVKAAPGYNTPETGQWLQPFTVVQIYATQNVDNADWNMIGPGQWLEARKVAQVDVDTTPPAGVTANRWIEVNLAEQTLAVYENGRLLFATVIASGMEPFWTQPGTFQIREKKETETMRNSDPADFYYLDNVPWTMYYDGARALHGAYWRTRFGYPQSHGCVNLSLGDAHWLFNWAQVGDWVYVHDPSGETPTDPSLYTGGAY